MRARQSFFPYGESGSLYVLVSCTQLSEVELFGVLGTPPPPPSPPPSTTLKSSPNTIGYGVLVFSHRVSGVSGVSDYFANASAALSSGDDPTAAIHKFSVLSSLESFRRANGLFEFKLVYPVRFYAVLAHFILFCIFSLGLKRLVSLPGRRRV